MISEANIGVVPVITGSASVFVVFMASGALTGVMTADTFSYVSSLLNNIGVSCYGVFIIYESI